MTLPSGSFSVTALICATVTDDFGVSSVTLHTNKGDITMTYTGNDNYCAYIPKHNNETVSYYVIAVDIWELTINSSTYSYTQND